jgi:inhibitor of KinA sporulation pathway (predicted exonuclease)
MKFIISLLLSLSFFCFNIYSQDSLAIDSIKKVLNERYEALARAMNERDLNKILSFRTSDFHSIGPDGRVLDHLMMKEYTQQFISNNIPPYNIKNTIMNLKLSYNKIVAVVDVLQEAVRQRELSGKLREVKTSVLQTETWIYEDKEWKLKLVDNVHDQKRFVDGKRVDPTKQYDPDDPPFEPDKN